MTTSSTQQVSTKVGALHVEVRGKGQTVFCWPSLFADARTLDVVAEDLARDHRVVVVDGPGHGKSEAPAGAFTLADCADAAMQILDHLAIERATWIGAAWGGHVGVAAALGYPERLAGLILLNAPMAPWRGRRLLLMRLSQVLLTIFGPRSFVARMVADKGIAKSAGPDREAMVDACEEALRRCDPRGLAVATSSAMFGRGDLVRRLGEIRVPTIFFAGTEDDIFPLEEARAQAAAIRDCRFVAVERSAHHSAMERPDVVLPIVREQIRSLTFGKARSSQGANAVALASATVSNSC
jgi:pimeloyl-ACP methyl ester carboxylesterase